MMEWWILVRGVGEGGAGGAVSPPLFDGLVFSTAVVVIECPFSK